MKVTPASSNNPAPAPEATDVSPYAETLRVLLDSGQVSRKGERTRLRLRIAAAEALEATAYQDLKVSDICQRAGVALGTFYVYFTDKSDISIGITIDFVTHLYEEARRASNGLGHWEAVFRSNLFFIHAYRANPGLMRSHVQLQSLEPAFREVWEPLHLNWLNRLARSIRRRSATDPGEQVALKMALALEQMVFSYIYNAAVTKESPVENDDSDARVMAETLTLLWFRAIHARNPDPAERTSGEGRAQALDSTRS